MAKAYCRSHYERNAKYGSPTGQAVRPTLAERFWSKVDKSGSCWIWRGATTKAKGDDGYGAICIGPKMHVAHRVSYEFVHGAIPEGLVIDHLCRVRLCVNPAHLEAVTPYENFARGENVMAAHRRKTHCKRGHVLAGENLAWANGGRSRRCRTCKRENERARRARQAVA